MAPSPAPSGDSAEAGSSQPIRRMSPDKNQRTAQSAASQNRDRQALARLGKREVLKRRFGLLSVAALSCTILVTWEGILELFSPGLDNGGPAGLIYGYIVAWVGTLAIFVSISELASMAPTAGGQYYWVYMLAPETSRKFMSYFTGWMTALGWQTAVTSAGFLTGGINQGLLIINYPTYDPQPYQLTLIGYSCILVAVFVNTMVSSYLPNIESVILFIHILGFLVILIILAYMAPHGSAASVFDTWSNGGMWPAQGLSFMVGLIGNVFSFTGADAAVHMAEEIQDAPVVIPRAIITSIFLNGLMGFCIMVVTLFGIGNVQEVLNTPTGFPFMQIFLQATNSVGGTVALSSIIVASVFFACLGFIATSSRMIWSFARDRALPFSHFLSQINARTSVPLRAVVVTTVIGSLLLLISIGSSIALNILLSINIFAFYMTYLLSCGLLLWNRCRGQIGPYIHGPDTAITPPAARTETSQELTWGPWHVSGWLGIVINAYAVFWTLIVIFFSFWPASIDPTLPEMNWSVAISGFAVLFSVAYYTVHGRHHYKGPIIEFELAPQA